MVVWLVSPRIRVMSFSGSKVYRRIKAAHILLAFTVSLDLCPEKIWLSGTPVFSDTSLIIKLDSFIFFFCVKRRAGLIDPGEVPVPLYYGVWVFLSPSVQDLTECVFLPLSAVVNRFNTRINATNIGDMKTNRVKPRDPITNLLILRQSDNFSICFNNFMKVIMIL